MSATNRTSRTAKLIMLVFVVLGLGLATAAANAARPDGSQPETHAIAVHVGDLGPIGDLPIGEEAPAATGPSETSLQILGIAALVLFAFSLRALGDDRRRR